MLNATACLFCYLHTADRVRVRDKRKSKLLKILHFFRILQSSFPRTYFNTTSVCTKKTCWAKVATLYTVNHECVWRMCWNGMHSNVHVWLVSVSTEIRGKTPTDQWALDQDFYLIQISSHLTEFYTRPLKLSKMWYFHLLICSSPIVSHKWISKQAKDRD